MLRKPRLIKGTLTNLLTLKGRTNFFISGNEPAMMGELFSSSMSYHIGNMTEDVVCFFFESEGKIFKGCFNSIGFKEGDQAEFVVDYHYQEQDEVFVYALRLPEKRCLWVAPNYEQGHKAMKDMALTMPFNLFKYCYPFFLLNFVVVAYASDQMHVLYEGWAFFLFLFTFLTVFLYGALAFSLYLSSIPKAREAAMVFEALGFEKPDEVFLAETTSIYIHNWEQKHGRKFEWGDDPRCFYY